MSEKFPEIEILLQESEHVQQAIGRTISSIYTLFGIVLPAIFGIVLFVSTEGENLFSKQILGFTLAAVVSLAVFYANGLWIEAFESMRYKYGILYPRMYALVGREEWVNFMQYIGHSRKAKTWLPTILFQLTVFCVTGILATILIMSRSGGESNYRFLLLLCTLSLLTLALFSSIWTAQLFREVNKEIIKRCCKKQ